MTKFSAGFVGVILLGFAGFGGGFALLYWSGDVCFEQAVPAERRGKAPKAPGQRVSPTKTVTFTVELAAEDSPLFANLSQEPRRGFALRVFDPAGLQVFGQAADVGTSSEAGGAFFVGPVEVEAAGPYRVECDVSRYVHSDLVLRRGVFEPPMAWYFSWFGVSVVGFFGLLYRAVTTSTRRPA
jgi:hypothetical protein